MVRLDRRSKNPTSTDRRTFFVGPHFMTQLKKNVTVFEQDVLENEGYRYTTNAGFSSVVANRRMTEATLKWLGPELHQVLDAGCGDGTYTHELKVARPDLQIAGYDAAEVAVKFATGRYPDIEFLIADMLRPETFPNRKFDTVIIRGILHHLSDPAAALKHCVRLSDRVIVIEPNGNNPILKVIEKVSSYHREHEEQSFSSGTLRRWCREAGYSVIATEFIGFVPMFCPTAFAKLIYFFQPLLERIPWLGRFLGAQIVLVCEKAA